jgi:hypothetical protein
VAADYFSAGSAVLLAPSGSVDRATTSGKVVLREARKGSSRGNPRIGHGGDRKPIAKVNRRISIDCDRSLIRP